MYNEGPLIPNHSEEPFMVAGLADDGSIVIPSLYTVIAPDSFGNYNPYRYEMDVYGGYNANLMEKDSSFFQDEAVRLRMDEMCGYFIENDVLPNFAHFLTYKELSFINRTLLDRNLNKIDKDEVSISDGLALACAQSFFMDWVRFMHDGANTTYSSTSLAEHFGFFTENYQKIFEKPFNFTCTYKDLRNAALLNIWVSRQLILAGRSGYFYEAIYTFALTKYLMLKNIEILPDKSSAEDITIEDFLDQAHYMSRHGY